MPDNPKDPSVMDFVDAAANSVVGLGLLVTL